MAELGVKIRYQEMDVAEAYDDLRLNRPIPRLVHHLEQRAFMRALAQVRRTIPQPLVLDAPCGTGRVTEWLLDDGLQVVAGDISEPMLSQARDKLGGHADRVTFKRLDLEHLELPDRSVDVVSCIRLFNHCERHDRELILREIARVSRAFLIFNISHASRVSPLRNALKQGFHLKIAKDPWTWDELARSAESVGFRIAGRFHELRGFSEVAVVLLQRVDAGAAAGH